MNADPSKRQQRGWVPSDEAASGGKLHMPATERNTAPILTVLEEIAAGAGIRRALELASGSGQHAIAFAAAFPGVTWQPSERDPAGLRSISAWRAEAGLGNLAEPLRIDLDDPGWASGIDGPFELIVACNLLHISPWSVTRNLLSGAAALLAETGTLFVYGCFSRSGDIVSGSNRAFDEGLRRRDPSWGVRDTDDVAAAAASVGLDLVRVVPMPANNTVVIVRRAQSGSSSS
ncbi:DUF938 domain-containing protein [Microbaculum marinum]|uniref:DUF938 domain-containing protein n=1 Tax=Microbaculum marinum TaxID=1764581 RepID=A0AAW9RX95_9HYPH